MVSRNASLVRLFRQSFASCISTDYWFGQRSTFILRELKDEPSEWFWALRALTGEDPTTEEMTGNREKLAEAWLNWGKENGYI
jgi:hypothetical protein